VHVGEKGWLYEPVFAEIERQGLTDAVVFLGRRSTADLVELYNAATALVYPSVYEGFGLPVLEAMRCGCPVVCSDAGALVELADGAALVASATSVEELADALAAVLAEPDKAEALREKGLQRAQEFSWARCAAQTATSYEAALRGAKS